MLARLCLKIKIINKTKTMAKLVVVRKLATIPQFFYVVKIVKIIDKQKGVCYIMLITEFDRLYTQFKDIKKIIRINTKCSSYSI